MTFRQVGAPWRFTICTEPHGWERSGTCKLGCLPLTQKNLHNLHGVLAEPNPEKRREPFVWASAAPNFSPVFTFSHGLGALSAMAAGNERGSVSDRFCPHVRHCQSHWAWDFLRGWCSARSRSTSWIHFPVQAAPCSEARQENSHCTRDTPPIAAHNKALALLARRSWRSCEFGVWSLNPATASCHSSCVHGS